VGEQGRLYLVGAGARAEGAQATQDAGGAEPALAGAGGEERGDEAVPNAGVEAIDGGDGPTCDPAQGGDTGNPGRAIDQYGAAPALTLGTASVLDAAKSQLLAQGVEQGEIVTTDDDRAAVDGQIDGTQIS